MTCKGNSRSRRGQTKNPAARGFPILAAFTSGRRAAARKALAGTSSGGQPAPNCAGSRPAIRTAMPAWSAAARDLRDVQRLLQRKGQRRDRPRVEGNHGERTTRRYSKSRQTTKLTTGPWLNPGPDHRHSPFRHRAARLPPFPPCPRAYDWDADESRWPHRPPLADRRVRGKMLQWAARRHGLRLGREPGQ